MKRMKNCYQTPPWSQGYERKKKESSVKQAEAFFGLRSKQTATINWSVRLHIINSVVSGVAYNAVAGLGKGWSQRSELVTNISGTAGIRAWSLIPSTNSMSSSVCSSDEDDRIRPGVVRKGRFTSHVKLS